MYASGFACLHDLAEVDPERMRMSPGTSRRQPSMPLLGSPSGASQRFGDCQDVLARAVY
jgi:hypothetical protein